MASLLELGISTGRWDSGLKKAQQSLNSFVQSQGGLQQALDKENKKIGQFVQMMGKMDSTAKTSRGQMNEYKNTIEQLTAAYNRMSEEQKKTVGKDFERTISQLKDKFQQAKASADDLNKSLGQTSQETLDFGNVLGTLGNKLGVSSELMGVLTSGTIGYTTAIGAGVTAVAAATKAWAEYNSELAKQSQITSVTTGLSGEEGGAMTDFARSIASTYDVDFREVIQAANTLMQQFGRSGDEAMQLIRDGMQGMIQGDGGKLLQMIQNYGPAFRSAGIEASQLVAVIQNSEGGLFTDQNMQAIVMGISNIRNMSKQTAEALTEIGVNADDMKQRLHDGSMTVFEALQQVSAAIENNRDKTDQVGAVMQAVFGRSARMAGDNLGKAIANLNTNLEETKRQTGEVGQAFYDLQIANENLEKAMRDCFGYNGWEEMAISLKGSFYNALTNTLEVINQTRDMIDRVYSAIENVGNSNGFIRLLNKVLEANLGVVGLYRSISSLFGSSTAPSGGGILGKLQSGVSTVQSSRDVVHGGSYTVTSSGGRITSAVHRGADGTVIDYTGRTGGNVAASTGGGGGRSRGGRSGGGGTTTPKYVPLEGSIDFQAAKVAELQKQWKAAADDDSREKIKKQIEEATRELDRLQGKVEEVNIYDNLYDSAGNKISGEGSMSTGDDRTYAQQMMDSVRESLAHAAEDADRSTMKTIMETLIKNGLEDMEIDWNGLGEKILGNGIEDEEWQNFVDQINEKLAELHIDPINIDFKTGTIRKQAKEMKSDWQAAASAIQSVGSAMSQIEDPAAKVIGTIAQAIASIALGAGQAIAQAGNGSAGGPWGWIAFAAAATATMLSTIAAVKSATKGGFAEGGIVPGNSMSGDNLRLSDYGINSQELILNRAQAGIIAHQLEGNGIQNLRLSATISGEQIRLALNNNGKRTGRGEYVTTNFMR